MLLPEPNCLVEYHGEGGNIYTYIYIYIYIHTHNFTAAIKWHIFNTFQGTKPEIHSANSLLLKTFITCTYHKMADTSEKIRQTKEDITYKNICKQYLETILKKNPSAFTVNSQHQNSTTYNFNNNIFLMNINRNKTFQLTRIMSIFTQEIKKSHHEQHVSHGAQAAKYML